MTVASCGEEDEVKPDTELGTDGNAGENQESSEETDNGETDLENPDGGVVVDLGLPSGTLWADRNIGADSPEDYGYYFAWGETKQKDTYSWDNYKWCDGSYVTQIKYCTDSYYGTIDDRITLEPEDDAATANWGGGWCMPSEAQLQELCEECTWTWTTQNGVKGYKVTGTNGNSIFLPAAGSRVGDYRAYAGSNGCYWSRSLIEISPCIAWYLVFDKNYYYLGDFSHRYYAFPVRAVVR